MEQPQTASSRTATSWLVSVTGRSKLGILALTLLRSAVSLVSVAFALLLREVIDSATSGDRAAFFSDVAALAGLIVAQLALQALIRWLNELLRAKVENALKRRTYETILTRQYAALAAFHTGELQNRMTNDCVVVADGMATIVPNTVAMVVKLVAAAAVLAALDARFAFVFLVGGTVLLVVTYGFRKIMKRLHKRVQEADGQVRSFLQETVGNLMVLRSYGGEKPAAGLAGERMERHRAERMHRTWFSNICNLGFGAVMNAGYLFGLVWCGTGILEGTVSYGTLTAVLQLVGQIQTPFANMTGYLPQYYAMVASAERLMELEGLPAEDHAGKLSPRGRDGAYARLSRIELREVSFAYPDERPVRQDDGRVVLANPLIMERESLTIKKGEFVAITGRSGIGKSTLLKLLLAIYEPDEGTIELVFDDGDVRPVSPAVRPLFAYVPQGNFLLSGTVLEAVAFLQEGEPDERRAREACRIACADFVDELPRGFDTPIGEKGAGISEGQAQRIAIARALYSEAPILLLDESTSALDEQTEERLLKNIRELTDKTVLIVTHRRAALAVCDQVIHVEERHGAGAGQSGRKGP